MASVVAAAPTDGAPPLALHKLGKHFGATHALKVVIGKWLNRAKLCIFDEPAAGVTSTGVIMISSYLPGIYEFAGALHVFRAGGLVASLGHKGAAREVNLTEAIGV